MYREFSRRGAFVPFLVDEVVLASNPGVVRKFLLFLAPGADRLGYDYQS